MSTVSTQVRLTRGGHGPIAADSFETIEAPLPAPGAGEVLVAVHAISLDPYQRIRIRALPTGAVPPAGCVGEVIASRAPELPEGSWVSGELGWTDHAVAPAGSLARLGPRDPRIPAHHYVGLLGLSGLTAYFGVTRVLRPEIGQRIVVSGAAGGVGQIAVQLIRRSGAEVAGVVSSAEKEATIAELGAAALNRANPDWLERLDAWAPQGLHGYYDNVWGDTSARIVERLRPLGQIALCGQMTGLADGRVPALDIDWYLILTRSITLQGFRTVDYLEDYDRGRAQLAQWLLDGTLRQQVNLVHGLAEAGAAFTALVNGRTVGKTTVLIR
jgi:NADPH-dependent curcumin reductase CurA